MMWSFKVIRKKHSMDIPGLVLLIMIIVNKWLPTATKQQPIHDQCDGLPDCQDCNITSSEWVSNITLQTSSTDVLSASATLVWTSRKQSSRYIVRYQKLNDLNNFASTLPTTDLFFTLNQLELNTTYVALVCDADTTDSLPNEELKESADCGYCSTCFTSSIVKPYDVVVLVFITIGMSIGIVVGLCLIVGIYHCCYDHCCRKKQKQIHNHESNPLQVLGLRLNQGNESLDSYQIESYSDGMEESKESCLSLAKHKIIPSTMVKISKVIGQGEFGVVYMGILTRNSSCEVVAVKSLKGIFATDSDIKSVTDEILKMEHFNHPNVMSLIGVCMSEETGTGGPSIIMPYMAKGSLLNYLRKESDTLKPSANDDITHIQSVQKLLTQICRQISKGMEYIASMKFVHRDLAARNCMIGHDGTIKVGDFGLTEDVYARNYFCQTPDSESGASKSVKLPLKWMALESIKTGVFSEKTDVWSFGVTCWEVFTGGEIPYPGVHPQQVIRLLEDEERLDKPRNAACSDDTYSLMVSCWESKAINRPTFSELVMSIESQLEDMADYLDLSIEADESYKVTD